MNIIKYYVCNICLNISLFYLSIFQIIKIYFLFKIGFFSFSGFSAKSTWNIQFCFAITIPPATSNKRTIFHKSLNWIRSLVTWRDKFKGRKLTYQLPSCCYQTESTLNTYCDVKLVRFKFRQYINHNKVNFVLFAS